MSTEKPFANYANADDEMKAKELKDMIIYEPRLEFKASGDYVAPVAVATDAPDSDLITEDPANLDLPTQPLSSTGEGGTPQWYETIYNEKVLFTVGGTEITAK